MIIKKVKVYVLYYKIINVDLQLSHYKFFGNRKDLDEFLKKQDITFNPIAIQVLDVSNPKYIDSMLNTVSKLGGKQ